MNEFNKQLSQGATSNMGGRQDTFMFYDTMTLKSTQKEYDIFATAIGQVDPTTNAQKTFSDTNLKEAKKIPQGQKMNIHKLGITIEANETLTAVKMQALIAFIGRAVYTFSFTNFANTFELPLKRIFGAALLAVTDNTVSNTVSFQLSEGEFELRGNPIAIPENTLFESTLKSDTLPSSEIDGIKISFYNEGVLQRTN